MRPAEMNALNNYIHLMEMTLRAHTERMRELDIRVKYLRHFRWIEWVDKMWLESK